MDESILLVLAGDQDTAAAAFVERWRGSGARLLRPADLSSPGWVFRVGGAAASVAVVEGERVAARRLRGVVTRLAGVAEADLPHVVQADRAYVAAEMSAFLLAWLSALPCPVWNRPQAPSLCGPDWRWLQWCRAAEQAGLRVAPQWKVVRPDMPEAAPGKFQPKRCSVIGDRVIGRISASRRAAARRLARHSGVKLLDLVFDGDAEEASLVGIGLLPDLLRPAVASALLAGCS